MLYSCTHMTTLGVKGLTVDDEREQSTDVIAVFPRYARIPANLIRLSLALNAEYDVVLCSQLTADSCRFR